jgi:23S rRNA (adenine2503-C2)-methyltransferase
VLPDIKSLTRDELEAQFAAWRQPGYRVAQLLQWLYARRVTTWNAMTNLPKPLHEALGEKFSLQTLELVRKQGSPDTTQKFLWRLRDHSLIESVLIPANPPAWPERSRPEQLSSAAAPPMSVRRQTLRRGEGPALYGQASDRRTLCLSTQVGCAYGCKFCASGLDGWKRNLTADEIIEQVLAVERLLSSSTSSSKEKTITRTRTTTRMIDNIVVMGMGEPLANYDNLIKALKILNAPWGGGVGARKITISTSGLAPQIRKLAAEPLQFRLAVSLHGATDEVRNKIMPVNRKYPLKELVAACEHYQAQKGRILTFEYILIAGVNDSVEQAGPLAALAKKLFAKVNLIPYNRVEGLPWKRPAEEVCEAFLAALERQKVTATLRREKGGDIDAACGQLRLKTEKELAIR